MTFSSLSLISLLLGQPYSIAPNLLTLIGAFPLLPITLACLYYAPTLTEACPTWVYVACFVAQFFYQTMDAVDGKHARNTKASSYEPSAAVLPLRSSLFVVAQ